MVDERAELVLSGLDVIVTEVLIQKLVILFVVEQVLVDDTLLRIQVPRQLIGNVHLIMLVLNLPEFLERHPDPFNDLVELRSMNYDLFVLFRLFQSHEQLFQLLFRHGLHDWFDLVSGLRNEILHL